MEYLTKSAKETGNLAAKMAKKVTAPHRRTEALIIALEGELGVGKTTFVRGFAKAVGVKQKITSPTFVILKVYSLELIAYSHLYHIDAYRLKDHTELIPLGIEEIFSEGPRFSHRYFGKCIGSRNVKCGRT